MYTDKILEAFEKIGFGGNTPINQAKFNEILTKLMVALCLSSLLSPTNPTTRMWPMSFGSRLRKGRTTLK